MNLREAAFHEASHAVVADALQCGPARVELWRVARDGATWVQGRTHFATPHTGREYRLIALAGAVGEVLSGPLASNFGDALMNPILSAISVSDARNAGHFSRSDLDQCLVLVTRLWPSINARAALETKLFYQREAAGAAASA